MLNSKVMASITEKLSRETVIPILAIIMYMITGYGNHVVAGHYKFFTDIDGWEKPEEIDVYTPETLWDIINGAADVFMAYDFQELYWGEYTCSDDNSVYIVMEIYRQGSPVNAFGVYSQERPGQPELIDVGVQGYTAPGVLHFFVADCYVKIRSHDRSDKTARAMEEMAKHVSGILDPDPQFPPIVNMLPEKGKVEYSEQYINTNFLGHPFLSEAFVTTYDIDGKQFNLFVIKKDNRDESKKILADYYEFSQQDPEELTDGIHRINDRWNGEVGIVWKDNLLYGYYNLDDNELQDKYLELFSGL